MRDLRSYLAELGAQLVQIDTPVDPTNDVGIISSTARGPFILNKLKGFDEWRLTDMLIPNRDYQAIALGTTSDRVVQTLEQGLYFSESKKGKIVESAPCQEVVLTGKDVDIRKLPIPIHSVGDGGSIGGRYLGSGVTITKDPETGIRNEAFIRTQIRDNEPRRVGFWMAARHNWEHYKKYEKANEPMPMAFAVGVHPLYEIVANYSGPHPEYDELEMAAGILKEPLELAKCKTIDLEVPAHAELVIEGVVPPHLREEEGPFGEFTGFQGGKIGMAPVMEITAITYRKNPIFRHAQATVITDHQPLVALPMEAAIYHNVKNVHGNSAVSDVYVPPYAALFTVIIKMSAQWDGQAQAVGMQALFGVNLHPKIAIIVDDDVNIYDAEDILWAITQRTDPAKDIHVIPHQRIHPLDQSVSQIGNDVTVMRVGGKVIIDATKPAKWRPKEREEFTRVKPSGFGNKKLDEILRKVARR